MSSPSALVDALTEILQRYVARSLAEVSVHRAINQCGCDPTTLSATDRPKLLTAVEQAARPWIAVPESRRECSTALRDLLLTSNVAVDAETIPIRDESDIVYARSEVKNRCQEIGFRLSTQVKVATIVSELARNIVQYARPGTIAYRALGPSPPGIEITAQDTGTGIGDLETIMSGRYRSRTGMGRGLFVAKKMADEFEIDTSGGGTVIRLVKYVLGTR